MGDIRYRSTLRFATVAVLLGVISWQQEWTIVSVADGNICHH